MNTEKKNQIDDWVEVELGEVLNYEQPYKYLVESTNYDKTGIPVLTAGKSFILGYTSETKGIYTKLPVIIFDDFTTDCKFVDFPFKVKSSAMKFLKEKSKNKTNLKFIFELLSTIKITSIGGDHKRRWISEYKKRKIFIPKSYDEQSLIAEILSTVDRAIEQTEAVIAKLQRIKTGLMQDLLTKGIDEQGNIRSEKTHRFKDSPLGRIPVEWEVEYIDKYGSFFKGLTISKSNLSMNGVDCILYGEIYTRYDFYTEILYSKVPEEIVKDRSPILYGDILFTGSGETHEEIGKCITYIGRNRAYAGGDIIIFRTKSFEPIYLSFLLNSYKIQRQKALLGQGSSVIHIYPNHLKKILIVRPKISEQIKISKKLLKIDKAILKQKKLLMKLQKLKTALMQDLLTGRVRVTELLKKRQTEAAI